MNIPKTLIIMGRSGSGKGTQIELLKEAYQKHHLDQNIFYFGTGSVFRDIVKSEGYTGNKIKEDTAIGKLVPDFIANGLCVNALVNNATGENQILIFDGYPRSINQAESLDQLLKYYDRNEAVIIHVNVSEQEVRNRLTARGRGDDVDNTVLDTRIAFYNNSVLPTITWYEEHSDYTVVDINGEGEINDIHDSIMESLNNL